MMPEPIHSLQTYNARMSKSLWDKAFFADKIPGAKLIIDYGCADGSLMDFIQKNFPEFMTVGLDANEEMVRLTRDKGLSAFTDCASVLEAVKDVPSSEIAVVFSSVFHEIFHYGYPLDKITSFLRDLSPQYIVVRDMMYDEFCLFDDLAPYKAVVAVENKLPQKQIRDFERYFGPITNRKNLVHLLLKYRYTDNWERECQENYFSYDMFDLIQCVNNDGQYDVFWRAYYVLPWVHHHIAQDFGIELENVTTHYELILKKKQRELIKV